MTKELHKEPFKCRLAIFVFGKDFYHQGVCRKGCERCFAGNAPCEDCVWNIRNANYLDKKGKYNGR